MYLDSFSTSSVVSCHTRHRFSPAACQSTSCPPVSLVTLRSCPASQTRWTFLSLLSDTSLTSVSASHEVRLWQISRKLYATLVGLCSLYLVPADRAMGLLAFLCIFFFKARRFPLTHSLSILTGLMLHSLP